MQKYMNKIQINKYQYSQVPGGAETSTEMEADLWLEENIAKPISFLFHLSLKFRGKFTKKVPNICLSSSHLSLKRKVNKTLPEAQRTQKLTP